MFTDFKEVPTAVKFYNTTILLSSASFGSVYFLNMYGKALAMNATDIRVRCKAEHIIEDEAGGDPIRHSLELQVRLPLA